MGLEMVQNALLGLLVTLLWLFCIVSVILMPLTAMVQWGMLVGIVIAMVLQSWLKSRRKE